MLAEHLISCRSAACELAKPLRKLSEVDSFLSVDRITRKQQKVIENSLGSRMLGSRVEAGEKHFAIIFRKRFCDFIICIRKSFLLLFLQPLCPGCRETNNFLVLWATKLLCWIVSFVRCISAANDSVYRLHINFHIQLA